MTAPCPTLGFVVTFAATLSDPVGLVNEWKQFLESRGLWCSGGVRGDRLEYAVLSEAWQATQSDRAAAESWLASRDDLQSWEVGPLEDFGQIAG